ncbi:MAG: DUF222 domain-containing protein, partial [Actinobacteria bacterium]|nr:DUF222 domain-containing protein [Actinomycetota bacterium]
MLIDMGAAGLDGLGDVELVARSRALEAARRRVVAEQAAVMREIERRQVFVEDGHRDVRAWYRATHRWSTREANACHRLGRLAGAAREVLDALEAGVIGVGQAQVIADAHANPRVAAQVPGIAEQLIEHAVHEPASRFEQLVRTWVNLVDQDGSAAAVERAVAERAMSLVIDDHGFVMRVSGPAADGVELRAALQAQRDLEWDADWRACVAEHGSVACPALMPRTRAQRAYDAFLTVAAGGVDAVVHYVTDAASFEAGLAGVFGSEPADVQRPDDLRRWMSQTTDGTFVPPADLAVAAIRGRIRHVITDHRGIVLHMGRRRRLFTGAQRDAVLLAATRCTHPG